MMWFEIRDIPGYRINHRGEVLSLHGPGGPQVLHATPRHQVRLHVHGKTTLWRVEELMARAGLQTYRSEVNTPVHHEAARDRCDAGHEFTPENTMRRVSRGRQIRKCKTCHRLAVARWRARRRASGPATAPGSTPRCPP